MDDSLQIKQGVILDEAKFNEKIAKFKLHELDIREKTLLFEDCVTDIEKKETYKCMECNKIVWSSYESCYNCEKFFCKDCIKIKLKISS